MEGVYFKKGFDELSSPVDERGYKEWAFGQDLKLMRGMGIAAMLVSLMTVLVQVFDSAENSSYILLAGRVVVFLFFSLMYFMIRKAISAERLHKILLVTIITTVCLELILNRLNPSSYLTHLGFDIIIIFTCYLAFPIALKNKLIVCGAFSVGLFVMLVYVKEVAYSEAFYIYALSIIFSNIFSFWMAVRLGRATRTSYKSMLNEIKVRDEIKQLKGIIPVCSYCKNIRDDEGSWARLEVYLSHNSDAEFSHGICPECVPKAQADLGLS